MNTEFLVEIKKFLVMAVSAYVIVIVALLVYGCMKRKKHKDHLEKLYKEIGRELEGNVKYGNLLAYPILDITHNDIQLRIFSHPKRRYIKAKTILEATLKRREAPDFVIYRKSIISVVAKTLGMQDILVGEDEFDRLFVIQGKDVEGIREFLNHDIRKQIKDIHLSHLMLKMSNNHFTMSTEKVLDSKGEFEPFFQAGTSILDYFAQESV